MTIDTIIEENFANMVPDFVSIDVEGMDLEILKSMDFDHYRPPVFIVETGTFKDQDYMLEEKEETRITKYMNENGYFRHTVNSINCIYVDNQYKQIRLAD